MSQHPIEQQRRKAQSNHNKDPTELNAGNNAGLTIITESAPSTTSSGGSSSSSSTVAPTTTVNIVEDTPRRPYPTKPSTLKAPTAYSLFSNGSNNDVYANTHYLSPLLSGKLWWDVNGDAKRGDYGNTTLNDMEYDYGIPNVGNIVLVSCDDNGSTVRESTTSQPYNNGDADPLLQSLDKTSGMYNFQQLNTVRSGRYYIMYEAPIGWRVSGNILPLGRKRGMKDGEIYYECVPEGGEGMVEFEKKARNDGDWDYGGYCGRSIGCMEIGTAQELNEKFQDLESLEDTEYYQEIIQGDTNPAPFAMMGGKKMVAMPQPHYLDVGLSKDEWPLPAKQYADATITLRLPVSETSGGWETLLSSQFEDPQAFGISDNRKAMSKTLLKNLANSFVNIQSGGLPKNIKMTSSDGGDGVTEAQDFADSSSAAVFALDGVDLFDAKIERKKHSKDAIDMIGRRYLRASRMVQEEEEVIEVTYTLTAQGSYRPPPHEQLGYFIENSINADPVDFARSLREDVTLPFQDLQSVQGVHLTVGPPPPKVCAGCFGIQAVVKSVDEGGLKSWATVPVILVSLMIAALTFVFFGRRLWSRRVHTDFDVDDMKMNTKDFNVSDLDINKEKDAHRSVNFDEDVLSNETVEDIKSKKKNKKKKKSVQSEDGGELDVSETSGRSNITDESKSSKKKNNKKKKKSNQSVGSDEQTSSLRSSNTSGHSKLDHSDTSGRPSVDGLDNIVENETEHKITWKLDESESTGGDGDETEEERRKRKKKKKKAQKKVDKMARELHMS